MTTWLYEGSIRKTTYIVQELSDYRRFVDMVCYSERGNKVIGSGDDVDVAFRIAAMLLHVQRLYNAECSPIDLWSQI